MIRAHISRSTDNRKTAIAVFLAGSAARQVIYVCPKSIAWQAESLPSNVSRFSFEDLDKRDTWLTINAMIGPSTALVMECCSRYARITSPKFVNLQRLSKQIEDKLLVDHVPLCEGIEYIYTPYSYLDRSILGFAHWYASRAEDRIHRIGQVYKSLYIDIVARNSMDMRVHASLTGKSDALKSFKKQIDEHRKHGLKDRLKQIIGEL